MNSTAVIIGAMLISPLMTPIVGLGFGLAIFDTRLIKQSLEVLLTQVLAVCLSRLCISGFLPWLYASSELIARTSNHLGCPHCYCWWDCRWIGSRKKKQTISCQE